MPMGSLDISYKWESACHCNPGGSTLNTTTLNAQLIVDDDVTGWHRLTSPAWPEPYCRLQRCTWIVDGDGEHPIEVCGRCKSQSR